MQFCDFRKGFSCVSCNVKQLLSSRCTFVNFLSSPIVFASKWLIMERINADDRSFIEKCHFENISSTLDGGAIVSTAVNILSVSYCSFTMVQTTGKGGVIFRQNGNLNVFRCCFRFCRSSNTNNNIGSNAILIHSAELLMNYSTMFCCWETTVSADSVTRGENSIVYAGNYNSSECKGCQTGGILLEIIPSQKCSLLFCNCYKGNDFRVVTGSGTSPYFIEMSYSNIIKNTVYRIIDNNVNAISCCFYGNSNYDTYNSIIFSKCYGDFSTVGVTQTSTTYVLIPLNNYDDCFIGTKDPSLMRKNYPTSIPTLIFIFLA